MTREEQRKALRLILDEAAEIKNSVEGPAVRVLAASITLLVVIIDEQSKRLDALEHCKATGAPGMPHVWIDVAHQVRCKHCSAERA